MENSKLKEERGVFLATSDLLQNDDDFVNEYLESEGFDTVDLSQAGRELLENLKSRSNDSY